MTCTARGGRPYGRTLKELGRFRNRIQVKTVEAKSDAHVVHSSWQDSNVDVVIFFARNSNWGVIAPAFKEASRPLNHETHRKFEQSKNAFLKQFHQI